MIPGRPANPAFIVIDTSVLLQMIATYQLPLLRCIRFEYKVQAAIVGAVESEALQILSNNRKFMGRQEQLKKALSNNTLSLLDQRIIGETFGAGADALLRQMDTDGQRLHLRVDRGEAYTHAAGGVLGVPVATNDVSAVNRLLRDDENLPRPILRFWDFIVFGHQIKQLDDSRCDKIRQTLVKLQESIPQSFTGRAFSAGLPSFYARLVDGLHPLVGASTPESGLDERLTLFPC